MVTRALLAVVSLRSALPSEGCSPTFLAYRFTAVGLKLITKRYGLCER